MKHLHENNRLVPNIDDYGDIFGCYMMINTMMTHEGIFKITNDETLFEK